MGLMLLSVTSSITLRVSGDGTGYGKDGESRGSRCHNEPVSCQERVKQGETANLVIVHGQTNLSHQHAVPASKAGSAALTSSNASRRWTFSCKSLMITSTSSPL
jgi:hypothetical protein